jgi:hypothetical protein
MQVRIESPNTSMSIDDFEVHDRACDRPVGTFRLRGGEGVNVEICEDGAGYGSVMIRNPNLNNDWVGFDFVRPGDILKR